MSQKINVDIFSSSAGTIFGGAETYVLNEVRGLSQDFNIRLIVGHGSYTDDFNAIRKASGIEYISFPFLSRHSAISTGLQKAGLLKKVNEFDIEALCALASMGKLKGALSKTDILEINYPTESLIIPFLPRRIKKVMHFHGADLPPLYAHLQGFINKHVDCFVTCSYWAKKELEKKISGENEMKVIYNGVDPVVFQPAPHGDLSIDGYIDHGLIKIGTVGRLSCAKGTDLLMEAASTFQGEAEFFAVGPLDPKLSEMLSEKAKPANFHFLGSYPNQTLPKFYNFIDCFVLPSLSENFPITILEAMSCAKPVIATSVGGVPEQIDHEGNGILVPPGDKAALKEALQRMIENREIMLHMGNYGRSKILEKFSMEIMYRELRNFYSTWP